jgi:hypothetical protein
MASKAHSRPGQIREKDRIPSDNFSLSEPNFESSGQGEQEQTKREDRIINAKEERKRAAIEAKKALKVRQAAIPTYHKRS